MTARFWSWPASEPAKSRTLTAGRRRHIRRSAPTAQNSQRSIASVMASLGGDRGGS
jgi:hypothetical protein